MNIIDRLKCCPKNIQNKQKKGKKEGNRIYIPLKYTWNIHHVSPSQEGKIFLTCKIIKL